jgi:DNA-binding transcriptional regulator YiaG
MMSKKIIKNYIYDGLGFPVKLHNIEMVKFGDEYHPKIDIRKIADSVIQSLILQKSRLTGNQIKFIRTYFSMSLRRFAKVVNESHMAVKKWENFQNEPTNMDKNIEIMLRLHIFDHILVKKQNNEKRKYEFYNNFLTLTEMFTRHQYV